MRWLQLGLVLAALVGVVAFALIGVRAAPGAAGVAPTPIPTAVPTPRPWAPPAAVIGFWERRDALLVITASGKARFAWRTDWCGADVLPPCDRFENDVLRIGAYADLTLRQAERPSPLTVVGQLDSTNADGPFSVGPITLEWTSTDLVELRQPGRTVELCRPPREPNFCDMTADRVSQL